MSTHFNDALTVENAGWRIAETGWDPDRSVAVGSNFMVGNGYLGYRGTAPDQTADGFVALVVTDTYDCADGHWRELTTAPNPLFVAVAGGDRALGIETADAVETWLDLRSGLFGQRTRHAVGESVVELEVERFASYDQLSLLAQRVTITASSPAELIVDAGIDARVWSLNGEHLPAVQLADRGAVLTATGSTVESHIELAVAAVTTTNIGSPAPIRVDAQTALRRHEVRVEPGSPLVVTTFAAVTSSNDATAPDARAQAVVTRADAAGFDQLLERHRDDWSTFWSDTDVVIEGAPLDDAALRFGVYHNRICTPAHTDHLPVGARGLSCQAYQGAAFWDQEVYNLPAFLFTQPEIARSLLVYRHRTLDGARRKAARLGYDGAYYAWVSGETGDELCPDVFFQDVLTGRDIRNHFNVWQMHVAPDVVTVLARYVEVTGDIELLIDHGAEIAFEVARFLRSFVRYDDWRGVYHCIRLLGPDEWHENVDDNAFTNHQTHAALAFAIDTFERLRRDHPERLADLSTRLRLVPEEVDRWRQIRDRLLLPEPDPTTGLIEQFDGFFDLEDISPSALAERLLDPSEYWGWPNGIAVRTQVSKQADVAMLLWLHPDRFDDATVAANYDYYEPRCSHQSSLSHAAYGMVAARLGRAEVALDHFRHTATVDLLNTNHAVVAGTFIGGIHTAACGGTMQLAVQGIGGLSYDAERLVIRPALPAAWTSLRYPVRRRDQRFVITVDHDTVTIEAHIANSTRTVFVVADTEIECPPGSTIAHRLEA